jgi:hypothetical protein
MDFDGGPGVSKAGFFHESDGSLSMRRLLAFWFALLAPAAFAFAFRYADKGWWVFLPGSVFIGAALVCVFFTTWSDITELIKGALGKSSAGGTP